MVEPGGIVERAALVREAVEQASAEVTSEDHSVTVVAGPAGSVRDLLLSPRAFRMSGEELGALIVATAREANTEVHRALAEAMTEIMGGGTGSARLFGPTRSPQELRAELDRSERESGGAL